MPSGKRCKECGQPLFDEEVGVCADCVECGYDEDDAMDESLHVERDEREG
jgi:hypothetical protein